MTEPKELRPGMPECPEWLVEDAKKHWRELAVAVWEMGLLSEATVPLLASYCDIYSDFIHESELLQKEGLTFTSKSGFIRANPLVKIHMQHARELQRLSGQLGLTPMSRAKKGIRFDNETGRFTHD